MEKTLMSKKQSKSGNGKHGSHGKGGFLGGLTNLIEKLSELAENGEELKRTGELNLDPKSKLRGVYGFTIKTGLNGNQEGVKVEPFGNVREDEQTGRPVVHEVREPMVDVFEEDDEVLIIAEMPGVGADDVHLELTDDILIITAKCGDKKYRKEVLLPSADTERSMTSICRNGVLEVRLTNEQEKANRDA
jgi:HSP20 family protein